MSCFDCFDLLALDRSILITFAFFPCHPNFVSSDVVTRLVMVIDNFADSESTGLQLSSRKGAKGAVHDDSKDRARNLLRDAEIALAESFNLHESKLCQSL